MNYCKLIYYLRAVQSVSQQVSPAGIPWHGALINTTSGHCADKYRIDHCLQDRAPASSRVNEVPE